MNPTVIKCGGCGKLFKIYPHQTYEGDPNYCPLCNKKAEGNYEEELGKWDNV